jgi:ZIP family zinc transporter
MLMEFIYIGFTASLLAGLATGVGALPIILVRRVPDSILDILLGFAAGAMLFVVVDEMVPESHRKGFGREATFGLVVGFIIMMLLDSLFK